MLVKVIHKGSPTRTISTIRPSLMGMLGNVSEGIRAGARDKIVAK